jgi:hypothetical protein
MSRQLSWLAEPELMFAHSQRHQNPKVGLSLFGPLSKQKPQAISLALVGSPESLNLGRQWIRSLRGPYDGDGSLLWPFFPGFEAIYGSHLDVTPVLEIEIDPKKLHQCARISDEQDRVKATVSLFVRPIAEAVRREEGHPHVWFIIIPEYVYDFCRPNSRIPRGERIFAVGRKRAELGLPSERQSNLLDLIENNEGVWETVELTPQPESDEDAEFEAHFRHQLKNRLLTVGIVSQIVRETTIDPSIPVNRFGRTRRLEHPSSVRWNFANALFYKAGGRPWKLVGVREGVCYVGLVFKQISNSRDGRLACCAAQMFLENGEGYVFRGAIGPWYSAKRRAFHLTYDAAKEIGALIATHYSDARRKPPAEIFIHGRTSFEDDEWRGFCAGLPESARVYGVRIKKTNVLRVFTPHKFPVMRGHVMFEGDKRAWLWTNGYVPALETYLGLGVPKPILVDLVKGDYSIEQICSDILALTKLNYNACRYSVSAVTRPFDFVEPWPSSTGAARRGD